MSRNLRSRLNEVLNDLICAMDARDLDFVRGVIHGFFNSRAGRLSMKLQYGLWKLDGTLALIAREKRGGSYGCR
jgi:hypothetical protein